MRRSFAVCVLLSAAILRADSPPTPESILQRVADVYQKLESFYIAGTATTQVITHGATQQLVTAQVTLAGVQPDRVRFEVIGPRSRGLLIFNAKTRLSSMDGVQLLLAVRGDEQGFDGSDALSTAAYTLIHRYRTLPQRAKDLEYAGEDILAADGGRIRCFILRRYLQGSGTEPAEEYWIDAQRFIVLKSIINSLKAANDESTALRTTFVSRAALFNEPLQPTLFQPPAVKRPPKIVSAAPEGLLFPKSTVAPVAPSESRKMKQVTVN